MRLPGAGWSRPKPAVRRPRAERLTIGEFSFPRGWLAGTFAAMPPSPPNVSRDPFAGSPAGVVAVRRVLVSVFDKTGLERLAEAFGRSGVRIVSTGGTRAALERLGCVVEDVADVTGFPEILDGRVKTLHPRIFAGVLARDDRADDLGVLEAHGVERFDAVIVNLYPFEQGVARAGCTPAEAIELIDIGGPSLVRAAAKNHLFTAVVSHPSQYESFARSVEQGGTSLADRRSLAAEAFARTADYDRAIAGWMRRHADSAGPSSVEHVSREEAALPERLPLSLERRLPLRYGENPHQPAALYAPAGTRAGLAGLVQRSGKELSYNNLIDLDAAVRVVSLFDEPCAVVVKHTNPCGAATGPRLADALRTALAADPTSAFGSILAVNRTFDSESAETLLEPGLFIEVIAAPAFEPAAVELLTTRPTWKASVRLVEVPGGDPWGPTAGLELTSVAGGLLAQTPDRSPDDPASWRTVTRPAVPQSLVEDLAFAFGIVRRLSSNAIAVCRGRSLVGAGLGQTSRVDAVRHALEKAGERARGGVLASDAFFPFPDSIELAARAGIAAIIQPGGSKRDGEVIAAADAAGLPMVFTGRRHFRH
jgi:phosphoribosylaminoimidazolecarboxamide formyltransferase/IMP cyclohydrolase